MTTQAADILRVLDLASVVVFAITGALVASRKQIDIVGFLWLGVVTGVGGGTLRDLLGQEPSILLRRDVYVTAAAFGSIARLVADGLGLSRLAATGIAIGRGFGVRAGALRFDLYLPVFRPRPGRIPGHRGEVE